MRPRSTIIFLSGALVGAGGLALIGVLLEPSGPSLVASQPAPDAVGSRQADSGPAVDDRVADGTAFIAPDRAQHPDPAPELRGVEPSAEWNALVGGMLEVEVERRTGEHLTMEKKERLLAELARLREASLSLQRAPAKPQDPAELRDRLTQSLALVQADQTFRNELGVGVAEFLQGLDPEAVEEVPAAPAGR